MASCVERSDRLRAGVATEIARILREDSVRDKKTGVRAEGLPGDIAILFRSRASHREFERELERQGIPVYVYKGLGFFDADETKDVMALIRYLAEPGFRSPGGGVPALAVRPPVGPRRWRRWRRIWLAR